MSLNNIIYNDIMLCFFAWYVVWKKEQKNTSKIYSKEIRYQYWHIISRNPEWLYPAQLVMNIEKWILSEMNKNKHEKQT